MPFVDRVRSLYRRHVHNPKLDQLIYKILDALTDIYCLARRYYFPKSYIRRWKLDMMQGLYEPETYDLFKKIIRPGMVIVDIGAHIGYFTRQFSDLAGPGGMVHAFEADPENFQVLSKNVGGRKNVKINRLAAADRAGDINFYHCEEKMGCHSLLPDIPLDYPKTKITVQAISLDDYLAQNKIERVDIIKMDIEGGETMAFAGMKNTLAKNDGLAVVTEFAPRWIKTAGVEPLEFLKNLAAFGFEIHAITEKGLEKMDISDPRCLEKYFGPENEKPKNAFNEFINIYCVKN